MAPPDARQFPKRSDIYVSRGAIQARLLGLVAACLFPVGLSFTIASEPAPLSLNRVMQLPLTWPDKVTTSNAFSDGSVQVAAGTELVLNDVLSEGVVVELPGSGDLILIDAGWTDLGRRAAQAQQGLPEDVRNVTLAELVRRTDLLPDLTTLVTDVDLANRRTLPAGTEIIPGRLQMSNGQLGVVVVEKNPRFNQHGGLDRLVFNAEFTDVVARMREQARKAPADRKLRSSATLEGKLVDAAGVALPASNKPAPYYVVYYAADWCGFCTKFTPTLAKFHDEVKAKHPEVKFVYLSSDRSAEEMAKSYQKSKMPWPAVAFDKRNEVLGLLTMAGPGTPHVAVVTADGRLLHDGQPNGATGANAALAALRRELNRPPGK